MKKTKPSAAKAKRPAQMTKEELFAALLKKKECNAKALSVVEGLLETRVSEQWLLNSLQFIGQSNYQDAIEERAILKICGYPLCSNPLMNIPKQQYRISTQNNKVYDISERKHFCSNMCYRSSSFLKDQIQTSPLWLRDIETVPHFKLLDGGNTRGKVGDEIDVAPMRVTPAEASCSSVPSEHNHKGVVLKDQNKEVVIEDDSERRNEVNTLHKNDTLSHMMNKPQNTVETTELKNSPQERVIQEEQCHSKTSTSMCDDNQHNICTAEEQLRNLKIEDTIAGSVAQSSTQLPENPQISRTHNALTENVNEQEIQEENETEKSTSKVTDRSMLKQAEISTLKETERSPSREIKRSTSTDTERSMSKETERSTSKTLPTGDNKPRTSRPKRTNTRSNVPVVALESVSEFVEQRLKEWFTVDSVCYLYGEQQTREMMGEQAADFDQNFKPLDSATWDPEKHERFVKICKRLNLLDLEDRGYDDKVVNDERNVARKPLPDFDKLKEEAEKMDLRVRAFYKGQLELGPRTVTFAEDVKEGAEEEVPVLPLVHQHEQRAVRRRIVLDALNRVLPDLLRTLGVNSGYVTSPLRGLIGTFALTAGNITLNPRQWTLVAIAAIKLLAVRETQINMALASEASQKYFTLIQMSFNLGPTFLDQLIDRLVSSALFPAQ